MRISDWSSDVCSSDLTSICFSPNSVLRHFCSRIRQTCRNSTRQGSRSSRSADRKTSELQSLMRISYAVFCLKKKKQNPASTSHHLSTTLLTPSSPRSRLNTLSHTLHNSSFLPPH